jgi:cbb3-type cytochrome oxidase subunit 3
MGIAATMLSVTGVFIWWRERKSRIMASARLALKDERLLGHN